jgi:hypothetical protein
MKGKELCGIAAEEPLMILGQPADATRWPVRLLYL